MIPDWGMSFFPHKCSYCGKKIKRKTPHICIWGILGSEGGIEERYCGPHCARLAYDDKRKRSIKREQLNRIIFGGE